MVTDAVLPYCTTRNLKTDALQPDCQTLVIFRYPYLAEHLIEPTDQPI